MTEYLVHRSYMIVQSEFVTDPARMILFYGSDILWWKSRLAMRVAVGEKRDWANQNPGT